MFDEWGKFCPNPRQHTITHTAAAALGSGIGGFVLGIVAAVAWYNKHRLIHGLSAGAVNAPTGPPRPCAHAVPRPHPPPPLESSSSDVPGQANAASPLNAHDSGFFTCGIVRDIHSPDTFGFVSGGQASLTPGEQASEEGTREEVEASNPKIP